MTLITAKNGKARPKNTSEQYDWLTKEEFEEEYSRNEFVKILKIHNHESLPDTNITKTSIYELERACQSYGSCSNCSGVSCAMVGVVDPVYNAFESTVQWHDCPEATEDGEYWGELVTEMRARGSKEWNPFKYKIEYIASDNTYTLNGWIYDIRQIWRIVQQPQEKGLDLNKLEKEVDTFISNQTTESYNKMFAEMDREKEEVKSEKEISRRVCGVANNG